MRRRPPAAATLRALRALILDVDGVLTDGGLYYTEAGDQLRRFDVRDGQGLVLLRAAGLLTAVVTGKETALVARRAAELGIVEVHQGVGDKAAVVRDLLARHRLAPGTAAYVGDDVGDLGAMAAVGVAVAVADAVAPVRRAARWVTRARGGAGAVREVCDAILAARGYQASAGSVPTRTRRK